MIFLLSFLVCVLAAAGEAAYAQWLTRYRLDIEPGTAFWKGESWAYQRNVYRRQNYEPEGQEKLWLLNVLRGIQLLAGITFISAVYLAAANGQDVPLLGRPLW